MTLLIELPSQAARDFLRTAVIIDDHAYSALPALDVPEATLGDQSLDLSPVPVIADSPHEDAGESNEFDAETVVGRFADLGINCAVLVPNIVDGALDPAQVLQLASRADIVVLDWILSPNAKVSAPGPTPKFVETTSLGLVATILEDDARRGSRLRLICIYTGDPRLFEIVESIRARVIDIYGEAKVEGYSITAKGAKIVVLAKEQPSLVSAEGVGFNELAERAVLEFSIHSANGFLPQVALSAVAAVRDGVFRLLSRFTGDLDPAVLSHRALTQAVETDQYLLSLVGDELSALVAEEYISRIMSDDAVSEYVSSKLSSRSHAPKQLGADSRVAELTTGDAHSAFVNGVLESGHLRVPSGHTKKLDKSSGITSLLLDLDEQQLGPATRDIDLRFSALSSMSRDRAFDGEDLTPPDLHLGTLLKLRPKAARAGSAASSASKVRSDYWLCIQPLCDSVRISGKSRFPLLPLELVDPASGKFDLVAEIEGKYAALSIKRAKFNTIEFVEFTADKKFEVVRALWNDGWCFKAMGARYYEWLGDLRLDKAHKMIAAIVVDAGRIGINEYEYLRRASSR